MSPDISLHDSALISPTTYLERDAQAYFIIEEIATII